MTTTLKGKMRGSRNATIQDGQILRRRFTESYIVTSDDGTDDEGHVYNTAGIPSLGDAWVGEGGSTNPGTYCVNVKISDSDKSNRVWVVEVEYSSELPDGGGAGAGSGDNSSPQNWDPEIEWTSEKVPERVYKDITGRRTANTLGEWYEIERFKTYSTLRYSRWQLGFTSAVQRSYVDTVNADYFLGYGPLQARIDEISAQARFIQGNQFWWVTYIVKFNPDTWNHYEPMRGTKYVDFVGGPEKSAMEEQGTSFVNLNRDGTLRNNVQPLLDVFLFHRFALFTPLIVGS